MYTLAQLQKVTFINQSLVQSICNFCSIKLFLDKTAKQVEIWEILQKLMTDIIGSVAFGMNFNALVDPNAEFRTHGKEIFKGQSYKRYYELLAILFMPILRFIVRPKFFSESGTNFLRKAFWQVINERTKTGGKRFDLIDVLIEIKNKQETETADTYSKIINMFLY